MSRVGPSVQCAAPESTGIQIGERRKVAAIKHRAARYREVSGVWYSVDQRWGCCPHMSVGEDIGSLRLLTLWGWKSAG